MSSLTTQDPFCHTSGGVLIKSVRALNAEYSCDQCDQGWKLTSCSHSQQLCQLFRILSIV